MPAVVSAIVEPPWSHRGPLPSGGGSRARWREGGGSDDVEDRNLVSTRHEGAMYVYDRRCRSRRVRSTTSTICRPSRAKRSVISHMASPAQQVELNLSMEENRV